LLYSLRVIINMNKPPDETLDAKSKPVVAACVKILTPASLPLKM
jgi:hypothetical protein